MSKDRYIEQEFPIKCKGRDSSGHEVLFEPVEISIAVFQLHGDETNISTSVNCPHNGGGHGDKCMALSYATNAKCPYAIDLPYALEIKNR